MMYKVNKLRGYIVQHREYNQYFTITLNAIYSIKNLNHYVVHLTLISYINYISIKNISNCFETKVLNHSHRFILFNQLCFSIIYMFMPETLITISK